jgi:cytochrome c biogenesis protein ResB
MGRKFYDFISSLDAGLWLMGGVMLLLVAGSFSRGGTEGSSINDLPLFQWLGSAPAAASWWLWAALALLGLLAVNTLLCSVESLRGKAGSARFPARIAPQIMHAGFLLILLAHLFSSSGGFKQVIPIREGGVIGLPDGSSVLVATVEEVTGPMGFPTDYSAEIKTLAGGETGSATISPNRPFFFHGAGFYLKEVALSPYRAALIEIHREPGAGVALAGALFFTVGNLVLLSVRRGK